MAFTDIRERQVAIAGRQVRLFCSDDGVSEFVAEVDGQFYGGGGVVQPRIESGRFWVIVDRTAVRPLSLDDGSAVAKWFAGNWDDVKGTLREICPTPWNAPAAGSVNRVLKAMERAEENYRRNAAQIGLSDQP